MTDTPHEEPIPMQEPELNARSIFDEIVARPEAEWAQLLDERCGDDAALRSRVRSLLHHHARSGDFLSTPAFETYAGLIGDIGDQIAEFRIVREIGRGGMGAVYLANDTVLKRAVALKVLPPHAMGSAGVERFRKEAQAAARLSHPGIVQIFRSGEERGFSYIVMEFVSGGTLRSHINARRTTTSSMARAVLTREQVIEQVHLMVEVADALDHAHRQKVVHRDLKPSNILVDEDMHAHLTDFGIARIITDDTKSMDTDVAGSFPYMSPEQARVRTTPVDHRTDIFSFGVVLYELLTHTRPFDGETPTDILRAIEGLQPRALRSLNPQIHQDLATVCHKALEKDPDDRYQTAAHLSADLRCWLSGSPILARPPGIRRRLRGWIGRHRAHLAFALVAFLIALSAALAWHIEARRRAGLSRLNLTLGEPVSNAVASLSRWDDVRMRLGPAESLGGLPVRSQLVDPGFYRLRIEAGNRFAEADILLRAGGECSHTVWLRPNEALTDGMALIDRATYIPPTDRTEMRAHSVAPFWIDVDEVTNSEYRAFALATGRAQPELWLQATAFKAIADLPVVDITRADMVAYALWAGKRLPTEVEWVAAALQPDGKTPPWGMDEPAPVLVPSREMLLADQDLQELRLVEHYEQFVLPAAEAPAAPSGLRGMFGNVMEMTGTVDVGPLGTNCRFAGGYWAHDPNLFELARTKLYPLTARSTQIGFRCARSVAPPNNQPKAN